MQGGSRHWTDREIVGAYGLRKKGTVHNPLGARWNSPHFAWAVLVGIAKRVSLLWVSRIIAGRMNFKELSSGY